MAVLVVFLCSIQYNIPKGVFPYGTQVSIDSYEVVGFPYFSTFIHSQRVVFFSLFSRCVRSHKRWRFFSVFNGSIHFGICLLEPHVQLHYINEIVTQ